MSYVVHKKNCSRIYTIRIRCIHIRTHPILNTSRCVWLRYRELTTHSHTRATVSGKTYTDTHIRARTHVHTHLLHARQRRNKRCKESTHSYVYTNCSTKSERVNEWARKRHSIYSAFEQQQHQQQQKITETDTFFKSLSHTLYKYLFVNPFFLSLRNKNNNNNKNPLQLCGHLKNRWFFVKFSKLK